MVKRLDKHSYDRRNNFYILLLSVKISSVVGLLTSAASPRSLKCVLSHSTNSPLTNRMLCPTSNCFIAVLSSSKHILWQTMKRKTASAILKSQPEKKQKSAGKITKLPESVVSENFDYEKKKDGKGTATLDTNANKVFRKHQELSSRYRKFVGAHISAAGGVENAPLNCFNVNGQSFAFFLKNQRSWNSSPLTLNSITGFKKACATIGLPPERYVLPHGSYLINLSNPDKDKREKSYNSFLDDIQRCEQLGIRLYNFHPGSTVGECSAEESIKHLANCINRVHKETSNVICVVENMAGQKNVIGSKFEELHQIIELVADKQRVGICLDTCHLFAAGYDIRTKSKFDGVLKAFDTIVGLKYLMAVHLNDSKSSLKSGLDRHQNIGKGELGLECFEFIMNDPRFSNIPIVLETPDEKNDGALWRKEIERLYAMVQQH